MHIKAHTLTQKQARLGVFLCAFLILVFWFSGYSGIDINRRGEIADVVGTLTQCSRQREPSASTEAAATTYLFIDTTAGRAYRYGQPEAFRSKVAEACRTHQTVRITYQSYQPLLYDWTGYSVLALTDATSGVPIFSLKDYRASEEEGLLYGHIALAFTSLGLVYLLLVWQGVLRNRDVEKVKCAINTSKSDDHLLIGSSERNGDSWAYLFLFSGLTGWLVFKVYSGGHVAWLLAAAGSLFAAYAYLVEVVNTQVFYLDDECLLTYSKPLPWIGRPLVIPIEMIEGFIGSERNSGMLQYAVSVLLVDEPELVTLFFARDLAEAKAVAELANERLSQYHPPA